MTIGSLGIYRQNGRIKGSFVYMLLCHDEGPNIYIKVGMTDCPDKRLAALRTGCPITPKLFYTVEVENRNKAKKLEAELLFVYQPWHHNGEWFMVPAEDKTEFNKSWKKAFAAFHSPSWPLSWSKVAIEPLIKLGEKRARFVRMRYRRNGRAYRDFRKDLRSL